jgi:hypothetical protein
MKRIGNIASVRTCRGQIMSVKILKDSVNTYEFVFFSIIIKCQKTRAFLSNTNCDYNNYPNEKKRSSVDDRINFFF